MPKGDGGWRRIHDLSHPAGSSVNHYIRKKYGALEYTVVNDVIAAIVRRGRHAEMLKKDLADAFRHVPLAVSVRWLFDFYWLGIYYLELFLPFGLRTAPFLFDLFSKALNYILIRLFRCLTIYHYLDDFFFVLPPGADTEPYKRMWAHTCKKLGLRTNAKKEQSGTVMPFLGIELDSDLMETRLPADKLERAKKLVHDVNNEPSISISHQKLDELVGFLSFCAKVVVPERTFLTSFYRALGSKARLIHINGDMRADLA